jgi:hypothetical protein
MNKHAKVMKVAVLLALAALPLSAPDAFAAKDKFERSKPHVNVGTIGTTSSQTGAGGMTTTTSGDAECPPDPSKAGESSPPCPPTE